MQRAAQRLAIDDFGRAYASLTKVKELPAFTTLTAFNSPEKACESRTPAIKLLTTLQTPEPITMSVEPAAHDRAK